MRYEFENDELEKIFSKDSGLLKCVIDEYFNEVEDANLQSVKYIFIGESNDGILVNYFFYDKNENVIYETYDYKEDLL